MEMQMRCFILMSFMIAGQIWHTRESQTQTLHSIASLSFVSLENSVLVSGGGSVEPRREEGQVFFWNTAKGTREPLFGLSGRVWSTSVSKDRRYIATGSTRVLNSDKKHPLMYGEIKVWSLAKKKVVFCQLEEHSVKSVGLNSTGTSVVSVSDDRTLKIWTISNSKQTQVKPETRDSFFTCAVFCPHNKLVAAGLGRDLGETPPFEKQGAVFIWDLDKTKHVVTLWGHTDYVTAVVFTPSGKELISASYDKTIRIWDLM